MNFKEAHAKLQEVSKGRYNSIGYVITTATGGALSQSCIVYVDGNTHHSAPTWDAAFAKLKESMGNSAISSNDIEEIGMEL